MNKSIYSCTFLFAKDPSSDHVEMARGTVLQVVRTGAGFKTSNFDKENLGGLP